MVVRPSTHFEWSNIFQVEFAKLNDTTSETINGHLKEEHLLIWQLSKKTIVLNVIRTIFGLKQKKCCQYILYC
jgi:hypothetical protein